MDSPLFLVIVLKIICVEIFVGYGYTMYNLSFERAFSHGNGKNC
jgi:hypothetical protein